MNLEKDFPDGRSLKSVRVELLFTPRELEQLDALVEHWQRTTPMDGLKWDRKTLLGALMRATLVNEAREVRAELERAKEAA